MIAVWQFVEHNRVRESARVALMNHAKDISNTLGLVLRSQRRFGGVISKERLESALNSLIRPGEVNAIALFNDAGEVVASAGTPVDLDRITLAPAGEYWAHQVVTVMNLVDLGTNLTAELETSQPTIVVPRSEIFGPFNTNRPPGPPPGVGPEREPSRSPEAISITNAPQRTRDRFRRGEGDPRRPFGRPFWMGEEEYRSLIQKKGVHSFAVVMSTRSVHATSRQDLWLRAIITFLASVSVVALAWAWRNLIRSSELEVRLVRAAELNTRLKDMNLAAAGLAHETKNPLNIVRGLAQMISKQEDASLEIRQKSREIILETDRVTAQLNDFINFSRPREVHRSPVALNSVVSEVVRALSYDLEEKAVRLQVQEGLPRVEADEQLLRQALFNLLLNAIQAVADKGIIQVAAAKQNSTEVMLEIRDNGPGVPVEHRADIFKPYFTTNQSGTGLGLAVVQQIVLAHGWEIECLANEPRGAVFRISHMRLAASP
jgi:signal transduction histidine kinase